MISLAKSLDRKEFKLEYLYRDNYGNNQYPILINTDITKIKVKFSFDNGPEEIIKEFNKENEKPWSLWEKKRIQLYLEN